jgi:hypothetical protein
MRLLVALLLAIPAIARADNPSLGEARKAVYEVRYDDAQRLLVTALKQGGNRPDELVEIYKLSAATAAVLGPTDLAEQYYRRMLALDPTATLPPDASPRLRDPFVAAQAYMAAQPRFDVRARRTAQGIEVSVVDPLRMVIAVATLEDGVVHGRHLLVEALPAAGATVTIGTSATVVLDDVGDEVVVLDENGNFLRVIDLPPRPAPEEPPPPAPRTPILRRWVTWAIPAGLAAGATGFLFVDAKLAHDRLDDILAGSSMHYLDEAEEERRRWRGHTISAWVGVGVTAALATTAIVMATHRPQAVRVTPSVGSDHASVQLEANF